MRFSLLFAFLLCGFSGVLKAQYPFTFNSYYSFLSGKAFASNYLLKNRIKSIEISTLQKAEGETFTELEKQLFQYTTEFTSGLTPLLEKITSKGKFDTLHYFVPTADGFEEQISLFGKKVHVLPSVFWEYDKTGSWKTSNEELAVFTEINRKNPNLKTVIKSKRSNQGMQSESYAFFENGFNYLQKSTNGQETKARVLYNEDKAVQLFQLTQNGRRKRVELFYNQGLLSSMLLVDLENNYLELIRYVYEHY